jgi:hypothetical protein
MLAVVNDMHVVPGEFACASAITSSRSGQYPYLIRGGRSMAHEPLQDFRFYLHRLGELRGS